MGWNKKVHDAWDAMISTFRATGINGDAVVLCAKAAGEWGRLSVEDALEEFRKQALDVLKAQNEAADPGVQPEPAKLRKET